MLTENPRRGWYHGWNVVTVCVLAGIASSALPINAFALFLHDWAADLHTPVSTLQLGIGACGLSCALLAPLVGILVDKYSIRMLFTLGLTGIVVFCAGISYVEAVWQYLVLYAVLAPTSILLSTSMPANALVSRWFVRRLGLALALTAFGLGMAGIVMPPLVAATMPQLGWRLIWRIGAGIIAVVVLPLLLIVLRDRPTERDGTHYLTTDGAAPASHPGAKGSGDLRWRDVFARKNFWVLIAAYIPMLAVYGGCGQNLPPLAMSRGLSQQTAGVLLSLLSVSQLAATLIVGMLSDKLGNRLPLAGLAFGTAIGGVLVAFGDSVLTLGLGIILAGFGGAFWPLIGSAIAKEFGPSRVGRVFGLVTFFLPLTVLSPFIVAKSQEATGSYKPALLGYSALAVAGGCVCLLLMRERRAPDALVEGAPVLP